MNLSRAELAQLVELAGGSPAGPNIWSARRLDAHSEPSSRPLTVAVVGRCDAPAVYLTVTNLRLDDQARDRIDLLVVDTDASGPSGRSVAALGWDIPRFRYVDAHDVGGLAAARDRAFHEADSDWVLCVEPGVLLAPGAVGALLSFIDHHPHSEDLIQGPRLYDDMTTVSTRWEPVWRGGRFGSPAFRRVDQLGTEPFHVPMQSLAVFACRRDAWPAGNPHRRGDSADEGYVHHKVRDAGRRTLCLPGMRWMVRPTTPVEDADTVDWEERIRNYLVGWDELGLPTDPVVEHFREFLGRDAVSIIESRWRSEKADPFGAFDGIFCINLDSRPDRWERVHDRVDALGIADRVRRLPGVPTPQSSHIGCALAHRRAIETAHREGLSNVLVLEDDVVFLDGTRWVLRRALEELADREWDLLYLGTYPKPPLQPAEGCRHLDVVDRKVLSAHAVVYHQRIFERLLDEMPDDVDAMTSWVRRHPVDIYLSEHLGARALRVSPMIATQESILPIMPDDLRDQYAMGPRSRWLVTSRVDERPDGEVAESSSSPPPVVSTQRAPGASVDGSPTVTAVMVTGHDEGRRRLARCTAELFPQQTYERAELLILNQGREPLLPEPIDRVREVMDGAGLVVGALRNLAWRYVDSDLMACWDDDDVHHPDRLATEVAAYTVQPVALRQELVLHLRTGESCIDHRRGGFENSLLWPSSCRSRYSEQPSGSDSYFYKGLRDEFSGVVTILNPPSLYIRLFHGRNIWDEDHIVYRPLRHHAREPSAPELRLLDEVLSTRRPLVC